MSHNVLKTIEFSFRKISTSQIVHQLIFTKNWQSVYSTEFVSANGVIISLSTERPVLTMLGTPAQQFANMQKIWSSLGMWPHPMEERYRYCANFRAAFQFNSDPEKLLAGFWGDKLTLVFAVPDNPSQESTDVQVGECGSKPPVFGFAAEAEGLGVDHQLAHDKFYGY